MAAVAEAASRSERRDVPEDRVEAIVVDKLQLSHARRVEQQAASGQQDELAVGRDVAASAIARPDLAGGHPLLAEQRVDQGRLAGPGRADEGHRHAVVDAGTQRLDAFGAQRARHVDRYAGPVALDLGHPGGGVLADVGLVEDHRRLARRSPRCGRGSARSCGR